MGTVMTLSAVLRAIESFDAEDTIYAAEPWGKESKAVVAHEPETGGVPHEAQAHGMKYFLEVFVARDFLADWKSTLDEEPKCDEVCARLIQYAIFDA
jgi:hypothetical protein